MERPEVRSDWYAGFFESEWLDEVALHIEQQRTEQQVDFLVEKLDLEHGERILDLACGHGRHAIELARRGFRVTGGDLSARSLQLARKAARDVELEIDFVECDMRAIDYDGEFDAVINMFTAFGYFEDEAENQEVVDRVARALRPSGRFLIDTINGFGLAGRYQHRLWDELGSGNGVMLAEHSFDFLRGRNTAVWTFIRDDGQRSELAHSIRIYTPRELAAMLEAAGLEVTGAWGDFEGGELSFESRRIILRGDKP